jgi:tetratricopeptide (TPR) repeat protein
MVAAGQRQTNDLRQPEYKQPPNFRHGEVPAKEAGFIQGKRAFRGKIWGEEEAKDGYGVVRQDFELTIEVIAMTGALPRPYIPVTQLLTAVMQIAAEHHRAGRTAAARTMYQEVLALDPRHADALFLLGVLDRQAGRLEEARRRLSEAARWAADRAPIDAELRFVEQLLARQKRKSAHAWQAAAPYYPDCSALATTARA